MKICLVLGVALALSAPAWAVSVPSLQNGPIFWEFTNHEQGTFYTADVDGTYTRTEAGGDWSGVGNVSQVVDPTDAVGDENTWGVFGVKIIRRGQLVEDGFNPGLFTSMDAASGIPSENVFYEWTTQADTGLAGMFYGGWDSEIVVENGLVTQASAQDAVLELYAVDTSLLKNLMSDAVGGTADHEGPQFELDRRQALNRYADWVDENDATMVPLLRATSKTWLFQTQAVAPGFAYVTGTTSIYWNIDSTDTDFLWNSTWGDTGIFDDPIGGGKADLWIQVDIVQDNKKWFVKSNDDGGASVVPEPMTVLGVFMGVAGLGGYLRKRRTA